ncbi:hypothetical protein ymoll0001_19080 [Yersinia mollaretii ATCC 43969]|uniref:Uncharacterized protein n=1 Tax=Yersinia mollaretii (strain ATCC 43969 / DSM 18520 / CIP 103324 / CNY 7263 / WAIP 204) TaxID=349967 RepID=A0ABM9YA61_YERMW|nr:hypothetical protein ymoll0001_19080 [Yersinia mollaretii ATCC 43969]
MDKLKYIFGGLLFCLLVTFKEYKFNKYGMHNMLIIHAGNRGK